MKRRKFISNSALMAGGTLLGNSVDSVAKAPFAKQKNISMKILATRWGYEGSMDMFCKKVKDLGYDGIEDWIPSKKEDLDILLNACAKNNLDYAFLVAGHSNNFNEHFEHFESNLERAIAYKPLLINCHSGKDFFSFQDNKKIIAHTIAKGQTSGVRILHESHRGRMLFAAHVAKQFIDEFPSLRLTLDISHWCNVHESLLENQKETIDLAISRTDHIHSRIGHAESPQISDPRAPEWKNAVNAHIAWWDKVIENKSKSGDLVTVTTEFGPPNYMPTIPYTNLPLANQWDINIYMKDFFRKRYL